MGNEATKKQIRDSFQKAIDEANNPDPRIAKKKERKKRKGKVSQKFGL